MKKYQITVTEKQLQTIGIACEIYGRIQYGQAYMIAEHIPFTDFHDKWDCEEDLRNVLSKYHIFAKCRKDNCDVAFDMWRKIIRKDNFTMSSEPLIKVEELE